MDKKAWKETGNRISEYQSTGNVERDLAAFLVLLDAKDGASANSTPLYRRKVLMMLTLVLLFITGLCGWWVFTAADLRPIEGQEIRATNTTSGDDSFGTINKLPSPEIAGSGEEMDALFNVLGEMIYPHGDQIMSPATGYWRTTGVSRTSKNTQGNRAAKKAGIASSEELASRDSISSPTKANQTATNKGPSISDLVAKTGTTAGENTKNVTSGPAGKYRDIKSPSAWFGASDSELLAAIAMGYLVSRSTEPRWQDLGVSGLAGWPTRSPKSDIPQVAQEMTNRRRLSAGVLPLLASSSLPGQLLFTPDLPQLPTVQEGSLVKPPHRWQPQLEIGVSLRPETGISPIYTYATFYARTGFMYSVTTCLRAGVTVGYNDLRYLFRNDNDPFGRVSFSERIPEPLGNNNFTVIRANYQSTHERLLQLNVELAYRLLPRVSLEGGAGLGRVIYRQMASFSTNIPPGDPLRTGRQPVVLRRHTPVAHLAVRYAFLKRWSVVARANLAFQDLTPDAIHIFKETETATGYQLGLRFGL